MSQKGTGQGMIKGRGAVSNPPGRFEVWARQAEDDGWWQEDDSGNALATRIIEEPVASAITRNDSPDIAFDRSLNPYQGCEHGCIYCYARPGHAFKGLSPGLDFETRIHVRTGIDERLRQELARPGYFPAPLCLGANTDPWQPVERKLNLTRRVLAVLAECRHPVTLVTKSALVERDLDLLTDLARDGLVQAAISLPSLDADLARRMEPRAPGPRRRLETLARLAAAGIPCGVLVAPVIPQLTDRDLERVLEAAAGAGAQTAGYVLLRLPHEVGPIFQDWLAAHYPLRAAHVMSLVRQMRDGRDYDAAFFTRQWGTGIYADLIARRFDLACRRTGLAADSPPLRCDLFRPPSPPGQLALF